MIDMNIIIASNIGLALKNAGKDYCELADSLNYAAQMVKDILSGSRAVDANELEQIADFCNVSTQTLVGLPAAPVETNVIRSFIAQMKTDEARNGIEIADRIIDMYLFHSHVHAKGVEGATKRSSL